MAKRKTRSIAKGIHATRGRDPQYEPGYTAVFSPDRRSVVVTANGDPSIQNVLPVGSLELTPVILGR